MIDRKRIKCSEHESESMSREKEGVGTIKYRKGNGREGKDGIKNERNMQEWEWIE